MDHPGQYRQYRQYRQHSQYRQDRQYNLTHSQNSLRRGVLVDELLDRSSIQPGDLVLDLGAGAGIITQRLLKRGCRVLAVEKDPLLAAHLRRHLADTPNVRVCRADILELRLPDEPYKVFSNIPFSATAQILRRLTRARNPPDDAYVVVQRQAAERFLGDSEVTLFSVLLAPWFDISIAHSFRRTDFRPMPGVDVVMLRLRKRGPPLVDSNHAQIYRDFVIHVFTSWKPTLDEALAPVIGRRCAPRLLRELRLDAVSPSEIAPALWVQLFKSVVAVAGPGLHFRLIGAERRLQSQQRRVHKVHRTRHHRLRPPPLVTPREGPPRRILRQRSECPAGHWIDARYRLVQHTEAGPCASEKHTPSGLARPS